MSISNKLLKIFNIKQEIKSAIQDKVSDETVTDNFTTYADLIRNLTGTGSGDIEDSFFAPYFVVSDKEFEYAGDDEKGIPLYKKYDIKQCIFDTAKEHLIKIGTGVSVYPVLVLDADFDYAVSWALYSLFNSPCDLMSTNNYTHKVYNSKNYLIAEEFEDTDTYKYHISISSNATTIKYIDFKALKEQYPIWFYFPASITNIEHIDWTKQRMSTNYTGLFAGLGIETIDLANAAAYSVPKKETDYMFYNCANLKTITNLNTGTVTSNFYDISSAKGMFQGCSSLGPEMIITLSDNINVASVISMFQDCRSLEMAQIYSNTTNYISLEHIFEGCSKLEAAYLYFQNAMVYRTNCMFKNCYVLHIPNLNFDTSNVTNMSSMFNSCTGLTSLDVSSWNTYNVSDMSYMFYGCNRLTSLDLSSWNTYNVTNMSYMFYWCLGLTSINFGDNFSFESISSSNNMPNINLRNIKEIQGTFSGIKYSCTFAMNITPEMQMIVVNGLVDLTDSEAQTLTISKFTYDEMTEEQIAVATAKNWTISVID